jgi:hypothetical protein
MSSPYERLCGPTGSLHPEPPDEAELAGLLRSGLARLRDSANLLLALESRFDLVYNAAHALCLAALRRQGFRARNRYVVFQLLPHTLGLGPEVWRVLDEGHRLRNLGEYEGDLRINARLVEDMINATREVAEALGLTVPQ